MDVPLVIFWLIFQGHSGGPMMSQASVEEDGVSWIDDTGGPPCTENVSAMDSTNLTPAEVIFKNVCFSWDF